MIKGEPEIYTYDQAPEHMRHQIGSVLAEGIGLYCGDHRGGRKVPPLNANPTWEQIDRICRKEISSYLSYAGHKDLSVRFRKYILHVQDIDDFLRAVQIGCIALCNINGEYDEPLARGAEQTAVDAIEEINGRFEQHSVGYQFVNGQIIRVDSKLTHAEIIKPALVLLTARDFSKANDDFMAAHRHYINPSISIFIFTRRI